MATAVPRDIRGIPPSLGPLPSLPHVVWARQADATVLLDAERGLYYTLNEVAGRTWELLAGGGAADRDPAVPGGGVRGVGESLQADVAAMLGRLLEAH